MICVYFFYNGNGILRSITPHKPFIIQLKIESEFKRQLEALGFKPLPLAEKKISQPEPKVEVSKQKACKLNRFKKSTLTKEEAKSILKCDFMSLYFENCSYKTIAAFRLITGTNIIPTIEQAKRTIAAMSVFESRQYSKDYSIAVLVVTGVWIEPRPVHKGMSKQIKARCERRDINASYHGAKVFNTIHQKF